MKGITKLSSLLHDLFEARNVAEETYRQVDRHATLEAICRLGDSNMSHECEPFLTPLFSFQLSVCVSRQYEHSLRKTFFFKYYIFVFRKNDDDNSKNNILFFKILKY